MLNVQFDFEEQWPLSFVCYKIFDFSKTGNFSNDAKTCFLTGNLMNIIKFENTSSEEPLACEPPDSNLSSDADRYAPRILLYLLVFAGILPVFSSI